MEQLNEVNLSRQDGEALMTAWGMVPEVPSLDATCIMAEERASRDQLVTALRAARYAIESIEPDIHVNAEAHSLLFTTMHCVKGLEVENVIMTSTIVRQGDREAVAPQLIYVALTRAKHKAALLTAI